MAQAQSIAWKRSLSSQLVRDLPSARHSFLSGFGSAIDVSGASRMWPRTGIYRWHALSADRADEWAIRRDWEAVGRDFGRAMESFALEVQPDRGSSRLKEGTNGRLAATRARAPAGG